MLENCSLLHEQMAAAEKNVLFIVGCGRSGTSLTRAMIVAHPEAAVVNETQFCHVFYRKHRWMLAHLKGRAFVERALEKLSDYWWIRDLNLNVERVVQLAMSRGGSWSSLYLALLVEACASGHARLIGDKSPGSIRYLPLLANWFPKARVLHVVRDPRAVVSSFLEASIGHNRLAPAIRAWKQAVEMHLAYGGQLGDRYRLVRYEDLVASPQHAIENFCSFLDLPVQQEMLDYYKQTPAELQIPDQKMGHQGNVFKPVFQSSLNKWEASLGAQAVRVVDNECRHLMREVGYETQANFSLAARLRYVGSAAVSQIDTAVRRFRRVCESPAPNQALQAPTTN